MTTGSGGRGPQEERPGPWVAPLLPWGLCKMEVTLESISFEPISRETKVSGGGLGVRSLGEGGLQRRKRKPGPRPGSVTQPYVPYLCFKQNENEQIF